MIKTIPVYTVICDNCGKNSNNESEYCGWNDQQFAEDIASEANWEKIEDKHYCPDCYIYNDDDELTLTLIK